MDFELTQLVLSSSGQYLWIRRDLVTNVLFDEQCSSCMTEPFFLNIVGRGERREVYTVLLDKGLFLKNGTRFVTKCSIRHLSMLKTVN